MRGEDQTYISKVKVGRGSPPHARGRRRVGLRVARDARITPACAGKTPVFVYGSRTVEDHPRMRGEDGDPHRTPDVVRGITPACAGKT